LRLESDDLCAELDEEPGAVPDVRADVEDELPVADELAVEVERVIERWSGRAPMALPRAG
jgi:hypothetical protein